MDINAIGKLEYTDDAEYELYIDNSEIINITETLDSIYNPDSLKDSQIWVKIMKGELDLFNEDGALIRKVDDQGVLSYFVCGMNLDLTMFNHTEEKLEFIIKKRRNYSNYGNIS